MNLEHSIKEESHERYPVHLQCLGNIKKIKYPDFQAMTSRNSLQRIMLDKADFLTDRETIEYFNILKEDHKNVMKFAQEAVLKKQQEKHKVGR